MSIKQKKNGVVSLVPIHASEVGIVDPNNNFTNKNVEGALQELKEDKANLLKTIGQVNIETEGDIAKQLKDCGKNIDNIKDGITPVKTIAQHGVPNNSDMNDLNIFKIGTTTLALYDDSINQTLLHTPYGDIMAGYSQVTWYNIFTFGDIGRMTQIATSPFQHNPNSFVRYKHDDYWSKWEQIATTKRTKVIATPAPNINIVGQNIYVENKTLYLEVTVNKIDGTEFQPATYHLFSIPSSGIKYHRTINMAHWSDYSVLINGGGTATILLDGNCYIINSMTGTKIISISAVIALEV